MFYVMTEEELNELKKSQQGKIDFLENEIRNLKDEVTGLKDELREALWENNRLHYKQTNPAAVNIGTYDFDTAQIITDALTKVRKSKTIAKYSGRKIKRIRLRGRGTRKFDDLQCSLTQSLPLDRAERVAIYVSCL